MMSDWKRPIDALSSEGVKELRRLQAENAKLRELLVDFRDAMWDGGEWTEPFDERMREMGIEVD